MSESLFIGMAIIFIIIIALIILIIISIVIIFTKAGKPGWAVIIPIYNIIVLLEVSGKPWWWIFLFLLSIIPSVGQITDIILTIMICNGLSKSFGKDEVFTAGLVILPFIFFPILAFSNAQHIRNKKIGDVNILDDHL